MTTTTSFITQALHLQERGVHHLSGRSQRITLASSPRHELLQILRPIYRKLQSSESQPTRLHKKLSPQNIPLPHLTSYMRVGRETTLYRIVAIVSVDLVLFSAGYV